MKAAKTMHEKILLAKAKDGDPDAYAEIFQLYLDKIYRFIFFKVATTEEAEDITSDVFLKAWQYIAIDQKEIKNLNAFLYRTARNTVIDHYRKKSHSDLASDDEVLKQIVDSRQQRILIEIEIASDFQKVEMHLKKMKDDYRDVILLKYIEEYSIEEISKILDKSKGAVRVLLHRALNVLKTSIQKDQESGQDSKMS